MIGKLRRRRSENTRRSRSYLISECGTSVDFTGTRVRATSAHALRKKHARNRIGMCATLFFMAFALLAVRLYGVSTGGEEVAIAAHGSSQKDVMRPEIVDRNGVLLATNLPVTALEIACREVWDPQETARALGGIFDDLDVMSLADKLQEGRYVEVRRELTPAQQDAVFALGLPGVRFAPRTKRFYPQEGLAAHIVGYTEPGKGGVIGLERFANAHDGTPLVSSIDLRAQRILQEKLAEGIAQFSAKAGWAAVMDIRSGEVVGLASYPDFDPNAPGASPADFRRNRALDDNYELGSAFKVFTAATALDVGAATPQSIYDVRERVKVADRSFGDYRGKNRVLSFSEVIQHSSNIGAIQMAIATGVPAQKASMNAFGLLDPLDHELNQTRRPQLPSKWGPVESATISFGHGISVTPLHLLAAFAAVVGDGEYRTPTFLKAERPQPAKRVISKEASREMRRVMRRVITDGTASFADVRGFYPIGKTGTAEKVSANGGYLTDQRINSFVGAFPGHAPQYVVLVSLDDPRPAPGTHGFATAGWNTAPIFSEIVAELAPALGVIPVDEVFAEMVLFGDRDTEASRQAALETKRLSQ